MRDRLALATVLCTGVLSGAGLLGVGYLADDWIIVRHVSVHGNAGAWTGSWLGLETPRVHRPLATGLYHLEYSLFGPSPVAAHVHALLWHVLAVGVLFALLRDLGTARRGALLGALLFALHPFHPMTVGWIAGRGGMVPAVLTLLCAWAYLRHRLRGGRAWLALALVRTAETRRPRWAVAAAAACAAAALSGGFNFLVATQLVVATLAVGLVIGALRKGPRAALRVTGLFACAGLLALGLAAAQLLPTLDFLPHTLRAELGLHHSVHGDHALQPAEQIEALRAFAVRAPGAPPEMYEGDRFVGPAASMLFVLGLAFARRPLAWAIAGMGALLLVLATGSATPLYGFFYDLSLPGVAYFKMPQKLIPGFDLAAAVVAALGVHGLLAWGDAHPARARRLAAGGAAVVVTGLVAGARATPSRARGLCGALRPSGRSSWASWRRLPSAPVSHGTRLPGRRSRRSPRSRSRRTACASTR